jgi:excisionase family DNA binding protein
MTLEEVATFLRVHPSTIYRLLRLHHIPAFKLGSDWRFRKESIEAWLMQQESARHSHPLQQENQDEHLLQPETQVSSRRRRVSHRRGLVSDLESAGSMKLSVRRNAFDL